MYLHVARAKIHLEIHGGVPRGRGAVLAVWWRQMMRMKGVQLLRRVELLMMKGGLMIAAEGVPPRLVPRAAATSGGSATPRATPAAAATADANPQDSTAASASDAAATARTSSRCELVRAGFNLPPDRSACNHRCFLLTILLLTLEQLVSTTMSDRDILEIIRRFRGISSSRRT